MSGVAAGESGIPVLRIIARLNVGGPAIQVINLTRRLEPLGYRTTLLRGREGPHEGSMDYLAADLEVAPVKVPGLRRELGLHDLRALWHVLRWMRRERPLIVHTHTAKAGTIGRVAALVMLRHRPPVVVHTFHGHVFEAEFSRFASRVFAWIERQLARRAARLIAVSEEVRDDLIRLGVARREQIEVVRLGFDLSPFLVEEDERDRIRLETRARLGIPAEADVVTLISRIVEVKRVDRFLAMARLLAERDNIHFLIAGDGDLRAQLESSADARAVGGRVHWAGFQRDVPAICFASDVVVLTSDSEGTPVALIEAQAAGVPVVATQVGGVETVILEGESGRIVTREPEALAGTVGELLDSPDQRAAWGKRGREHSVATFSIDRLVSDIHSLYSRLLAEADAR